MQQHRSIGKQISTISRCLATIVDIKMAHLGLSAATIPVIGYLYDNEGVHQDVLAEALQFDKSSATRSLVRLVKEGYVTKTVDSANKRRNIIRCTEKARAVKQEIFHILKSITDDVFLNFSEEEIEQYFYFTQKIHTNAMNMLREIK